MKNLWIITGVGAVLIVVIMVLVGGKAKLPETKVSNDVSGTDINLESSAYISTTELSNSPENVASFITIEGGNYFFKPNIIKVKEGDTVTINFKNNEGFHDFVIDEFSVATSQMKGTAEESVTFVASKKGSFEFYCSVGEHRAMGMKGTMIVE